jgi:hypothetical protein
VAQQRLDLGSEEQPVAEERPVERLDPEPVAGDGRGVDVTRLGRDHADDAAHGLTGPPLAGSLHDVTGTGGASMLYQQGDHTVVSAARLEAGRTGVATVGTADG